MNSRTILSVFSLCGAMLLTACGGGGAGVELGPFPDKTVTEGDARFTLTPPTSKSPAPMTIISSDPKVATISSDNLVTIVGVGKTTFTASQPEEGSYNPTSKSMVLTVLERVCTLPQVKQGSVCVTPTPPAT